MKATCPNNPEHKEFLTVATVLEEWKVDERGEWLETCQTLDPVHRPDPGNVWTCCVCGEQAEVE